MNHRYLLVLLAALFALGSISPAFAAGSDASGSDEEEGYYYIDDEGKYIEFDAFDPYDTGIDEDAAFFETFSTAWFIDHPGKKEYTITTATQLQGLANLVNEGHYDGFSANKYEDFKGVTIRLGRSIILKDDFTPIGRSEDISFKGTFDGAGHTIKGLSVSENGGYAGLFGYLDGTVRNLTVEGGVKSSGPVCGGVAGYISKYGEIRSCMSFAKVSGKAKTGGIAGFNDGGRIIRCVNFGAVTGTMKVGGVAGENWGTVKKCGNRGEIRSTERGATTFGTGGVCGRSVSKDSVIDRSFNAGNIFSGTEGTGGVCGYMNAKGSKITSCYNTGHLTVSNNAVINTDNIRGYAGGIVGIAGIKGVRISDCYNAGTINNSDISGGIIGSYLNESKFIEEPYIKNNYYISTSGLRGVGSDNAGKSQNYRDGTEKIAFATLISGASRIGPYYVEDPHNYYGAAGFPVLKWQVKMGRFETARLSCISERQQELFDRYLVKNPPNKRDGWTIMMFVNHGAFTSNAIGDFYEK